MKHAAFATALLALSFGSAPANAQVNGAPETGKTAQVSLENTEGRNIGSVTLENGPAGVLLTL